MATIKEIANLAGVSTTTVSNVIHGKTGKVSPANIEKINQLIKETGYVQKLGLRVLNKECSQLIAVVINYHKDFKDSILADPFYARTLGRIQEQVQSLGYYLMVYTEKEVEKIFQMVAGWDIDGVIAISFSKRNCEKIFRLTGKPVVAIDAYGDLEEGQEQQVMNVSLDEESGGYMMTRYLLECGYETIKICAGRDNGVDHLRLVGGRKAMAEHGSGRQRLQFEALGMNAEKRTESYRWLLQRNTPRTALFFLSDLYALEAIRFFHEEGVLVPQQIGVAGYDNISYSGLSVPSLTTVSQDVDKKAQIAVALLMEQIKGGQEYEKPKEREILLPVTLIVRKSARNWTEEA
ncbi:MAG: LacI family DNA-binding transcriptional regulator [Lachnospiraceae bacterium]|nr:LacI family DNA-binding transcriptional regulator [Lachnospiraceae bacterium]